MSSIASVHVVRTADLPSIVSAAAAGHAGEAIRRSGEELGGYGWSGYVMSNVLENLGDLEVPLESPDLHTASEAINADLGLTVLIGADAKAYLDRLDPAAYGIADLLDGPIELDLDDTEARDALTETLSLLRAGIARLAEHEVLVLRIG